jgi:hypothetical protein
MIQRLKYKQEVWYMPIHGWKTGPQKVQIRSKAFSPNQSFIDVVAITPGRPAPHKMSVAQSDLYVRREDARLRYLKVLDEQEKHRLDSIHQNTRDVRKIASLRRAFLTGRTPASKEWKGVTLP